MQRKKLLFHTRTIITTVFLVCSNLPQIIYAAGRSSHIDRALENKRNRDTQQKRSALTREKQKPVILTEKKFTHIDESKLTPRRRRALKRKQSLHARMTKHMSDMDFNELIKAKDKHRSEKNHEVALKYIDRLLLLCDPHESAALILEAGDILFESGEYNKAAARYSEFTLFYPGNSRIEYALYRAIKSRFETTLTSDRDQTRTHETLTLIDTFLDRAQVFTAHLAEVKNIQKSCLKKLGEGELYISEFYIKQGQFKSAFARLAKVRNEYVAAAPDLSNQLVYLEQLIPSQYKEQKTSTSETFSTAPAIALVADNAQSIRPLSDRF